MSYGGRVTAQEGGSMEVMQESTEEVYDMAALNCCWPPGTLSMQSNEDTLDVL